MPDPWRNRFLLLIAGLILFRLVYVASGLIDLYADEAYYWVWSKHPDWSYFSKGPLVAYLIAISTALGGDRAFFVRLPAVLGGGVTLLYAGRLAGALFGSWRAAFWTAALLASVPLVVIGSMVLTIDNPVLACWTVGVFHAWRAAAPGGRRRDWLIVGIALGLGLMAKAVMIFFVPSLLLFLLLDRAARPHLKTWSPWGALLLGFAFAIPQLVWNARHDWVMFRDFAEKGESDEPFYIGFEHVLGLLGSQIGVLSPLVFVGVIAVLVAAFRRSLRGDAASRFVLCFSLPVFAFYWGLSFHAKVNSNWMLVGYLLPLIALAGYGIERWDASPNRRRTYRALAVAALLIAAVPSYASMFTAPLYRLSDSPLLAKLDPTSRVWGWRDLAARVDHWREKLDRGRPIFIFDKEYQIPSLMHFYGEGNPRAFSLQTATHRNQYYFLVDLNEIRGHDAIAVLESVKDSYIRRMEKSFRSVEFLEEYVVMRGNVELHRVYLYHCRDFRKWKY